MGVHDSVPDAIDGLKALSSVSKLPQQCGVC